MKIGGGRFNVNTIHDSFQLMSQMCMFLFVISVISYHRGAQMGYAIYAVHRGATRRGQNKSLKMVFNKAFKIVEKLHEFF